MDYTAVGQTTHLAARMEQIAMPGAILITPAVLGLVEGFVQAIECAGTHKERGYQALASNSWAKSMHIVILRAVEPAEEYYHQALSLANELAMRPLQAHCHRGLARCMPRQTAGAGSR